MSFHTHELRRSNNWFYSIVLKVFIGIWSVHEKDWSQNNMNIAYKLLTIQQNLLNFLCQWKIKIELKKNIGQRLKMTFWILWNYCNSVI